MIELFGRTWDLQVGSTLYGPLSMRATVRWPSSGASTIDLDVWHPPPDMLGAAKDKATQWRVLAGYSSNGGASEIGTGTPIPKSVQYRLTRPEPVLTLQLSTRAAPSRIVLSRVWASVQASQALRDIAADLGLALSYTAGTLDPVYARGYAAQGTVSAVLPSLTRDLGCAWEIDGGTLRVWPAGEPQVLTADLWSPETGLLDPPETDGDTGQITAMARLRPGLRRGHAIQIDSETYRGAVVVQELQHEIDTDGEVWTTTIRARPR